MFKKNITAVEPKTALTYTASTNKKVEPVLPELETKPYLPSRKPAEISQVELAALVNKIQII